MEDKSQKKGFFNRLKTSVFKLEDYSLFLEEELSIAIKYFLLLILCVTIIFSTVQTALFFDVIYKGYEFYINSIPNFEYKDGNLTFDNNVEAYDEEYKFYFFANTNENITENEIKEYKMKIYNTSNGVIILKDRLIYISPINEMQYDFESIAKEYNIQHLTKEELLEEYNRYGHMSVLFAFFITLLISRYIVNLITIAIDIFVLTLFGMIAARICGIKINFTMMSKISIHAITLPVIVTCIYTTVNSLTGFVIQYYNIMYLLIAYVYIVAAIMMIKTDLMKQREELIKIEEVRKKVHEELEEEEEEKEKKKEEKDKNKEENENENEENNEKEPEINGEPDGSEI